MLFRFTVAPDAIHTLGLDLAQSRQVHEYALRAWTDFGVMIMGDGYPTSDLISAIDGLPVSLRKLWKEGLVQVRRMDGPTCCGASVGAEQAGDLSELDGELDLLCVDPVRGSLLGIEEANASHVHSEIGVEVVRFDTLSGSHTLKRSADLSTSELPSGAKSLDIWNERFRLLAATARNITIVDRYAALSHAERPGGSGLEAFLLHVDRDCQGVNVTLLSSPSEREGLEGTVDRLKDLGLRMSRGGVAEFRAYLLDVRSFGRIAHQRWLRFDSKRMIELDTGLEAFAVNPMRRATSFTWRAFSKIRKDEEKSLAISSRENGQEVIIVQRANGT